MCVTCTHCVMFVCVDAYMYVCRVNLSNICLYILCMQSRFLPTNCGEKKTSRVFFQNGNRLWALGFVDKNKLHMYVSMYIFMFSLVSHTSRDNAKKPALYTASVLALLTWD